MPESVKSPPIRRHFDRLAAAPETESVQLPKHEQFQLAEGPISHANSKSSITVSADALDDPLLEVVSRSAQTSPATCFQSRRATDTPSREPVLCRYPVQWPSLPPRPDLNMEVQERCIRNEHIERQNISARCLINEAKQNPQETRHFLRQIVGEGRRWRFVTYGRKGIPPPAPKKQKSSARKSPSSPAPPPVTTNGKENGGAVLDLRSDDKYRGLLEDIDALLLRKDTLDSGDKKNYYQRILANTSQLGLFRPYDSAYFASI